MPRLSKTSVVPAMAAVVLALAGCPGPPPIQAGCSFSVTPTGTPATAAGGNAAGAWSRASARDSCSDQRSAKSLTIKLSAISPS
jgi:hypothetical protein